MVTHNVAKIIRDHVILEVEGIDRMYLNAYVPGLQTERGFVHFVRNHLGFPIAPTAVTAPRSEAFVRAIEAYAQGHHPARGAESMHQETGKQLGKCPGYLG